jgi:soluble lytic murein transglycosylase-like protein
MRVGGLIRIVLVSASLALAASAASAQAVDERYPHLTKPKTASGKTAPLRAATGASSIANAARVRGEPVPYPRPAPIQASPRVHVASAVVDSSIRKTTSPIGQQAYAGPSAAVVAAFTSLHEAGRAEQPGAWPLRGAVRAAVPMPPVRPTVKDQARVTDPDKADIAVMVENTAVAHGVPLELAHAVVRVESNYNPRATGSDGTVGLMQIKPRTARGLGFAGSVRELYNPKTNLEWGIRYLAGARKLAKGNVCQTVLKYQGGHGAKRMTNASAVYCGKVKTHIAHAR